MRQVGLLAAAGLYALKNNVERLEEDHANAWFLAEELKKLPYVSSVIPPETNIVIFDVASSVNPVDLIAYLEKYGIRVVQFGPKSIRMVTHLDVNREQLEEVVRCMEGF
jgi:threonine aldolase